jgi:glutamyl-tRNA synthetase
MKIRTRLSPSPSGKLHIGNAHTFLFAYCFAKKGGGEVLLRFEDTDIKRNQEGADQDILKALDLLGIKIDGEPTYQSKNHGNYYEYAEKLLRSGDAYYCYHTPEELEAERNEQEASGQAPRYSGACRSLTGEQKKKYEAEGRTPSIRFRVTGANRPTEIKYHDLVFGDISYNPEDFGDFVIIRSDESALYNLANVVDDNDASITHIIRGNSHLTNTPRQILLYQALGLEVPQFAHLPDILNQDRIGKLSKRYGAVAVTGLIDKGYLSKTLVNFMGSQGWSHPEGKEFFDLDEMVKVFDFNRAGKAPPAMDIGRLDFYNSHYLRELPDHEFASFVKEGFPNADPDTLDKVIPFLRARIVNKYDIHKYADYFFTEPQRPEFKFVQYNKILKESATTLESLGDWDKEKIEATLRSIQQNSDIKPKDFFVTIGQAISGHDIFLPLFDSLEILGKEKVLDRLSSR